MIDSSSFDVAFDSEEFCRVCAELNRLVPDIHAQASYDGMSGGFKFPDEIPNDRVTRDALALPLVTVLRSLWSYRRSLVEGRPRLELEEWWSAVKASAPKWPGFLESRCGPSMRVLAEECDAKGKQLTGEIDELGG